VYASAILVLGHRGLLGRALAAACGGACQVIEGGRGTFDLGRTGRPARALAKPPEPRASSAEQARQALDLVCAELPGRGTEAAQLHAGLEMERRAIRERRPRLVFNCAAFTDVDGAEVRPDLAMAVNALGAQAVAQACAEAGAHLVHLSTDYVFDGQAGRDGRPYREDDPPAPLSAYGRSKLAGERLVCAALPGALIVRTAWLFGPGRVNFVDKVVAQGRRGGPFPVVEDEVGSPTYAPDLAEALLELGRRWLAGVLHLVNEGQASRLEMARFCLAAAGLDPELAQPITSAELGLPAARPAYSVLDAGAAARLRGKTLPDWRDGVRRYLTSKEQA
jgi:dTDP-4-dehydrorhamnose reductase